VSAGREPHQIFSKTTKIEINVRPQQWAHLSVSEDNLILSGYNAKFKYNCTKHSTLPLGGEASGRYPEWDMLTTPPALGPVEIAWIYNNFTMIGVIAQENYTGIG
jgi:hypothetical protein